MPIDWPFCSRVRLTSPACLAAPFSSERTFSASFEPDVLLCDLSMPHGDGFELIRAVRTLEANTAGHTPAAAITGHCDEGTFLSAVEQGFDAFATKPISVAQLIDLTDCLAAGKASARRDAPTVRAPWQGGGVVRWAGSIRTAPQL
jgi:CheY-like chemotaxis protein